MSQVAASEPAIGFYTVEESEFTGWTGGLLVLNGGGDHWSFTVPFRYGHPAPTKSSMAPAFATT